MGMTRNLCVFLFLCCSVASYVSYALLGTNCSWKLPATTYPAFVKIWTPELETAIPSLRSDRRIFFHETSGKGHLNFIQTCCVEAAAKHHPKRPVQVFLSADDITNANPWLGILTRYNNTEIYLLDNYEYFKGTEFESWYVKGEWKKSPFKTAHMSDYSRINTIKRGGGLYMDLDLLAHRSFDEKTFRNFLVYEGAKRQIVANTIFHLEKGHPLIKEIIKVMVSEYDPDDYIFHGPEAITAAMYYLCGLNRGIPETNKCDNVKLLAHSLINPIASFLSNLYFIEEGLKDEWVGKVNASFATHHFVSIGHAHLENLTSEIKSNHLFSRLARDNCPLTVSKIIEFQ